MSERNGVPGQREPPGGALERLADRVAPGQRVAAVVHLVEDHQRRRGLGPRARAARACWPPARRSPRRRRTRARARPCALLKLRVERDADPRGRVGPLPLEVLGGRDDGHAPHHAAPRAARWRAAARTSSCRRRAWRPRGSRAGWRVRYCSSASACQARSLPAVPHGRTRGERRRQVGGRRRGRVGRGEGGRARGGRHAPPLPGLRPKPHLRPPPDRHLPPLVLSPSPSCGSRRPS